MLPLAPLFAGVLLAAPSFAQVADLPFARLAWRTREVAVGVTWRQARAESLFGGPQQLTVLTFDSSSGEARVQIAAPDRGLAPASALARERGAIAAVNGGFFAKDGSADDLLWLDGVLRRAPQQRRPATLVVRDDGVQLDDTDAVARAVQQESLAPAIRFALAAGPWLVRDGRIVCKPEGPRHPRTAVGRAGSALTFLTVDGRASEAIGMTMHELAQAMLAIGCRDAFNLDGGGSTTMWVQSLGGVVNCPCDDKKFDAAGERAVGNAVVLLGRPIWTFDEDTAVLAPDGAFAAVREPACVDGDCAVAERGGSATFDVAAVPADDVVVEVRTRRGDQVQWSFAGRDGTLTARAHGWCTLDEFALAGVAERKLTLRSARAFAVDAVRIVRAAR